MIKKHRVFIFFSVIYFVFCIVTYRDFGITWDEIDVYKNGRSLYQYVFEGKSDLVNTFAIKKGGMDIDVLYSYVYSMFLFGMNKTFSMEKFHLLNLLFSYLAYFTIYIVLFIKYKKPYFSILGVILLSLTPRFVGDMAANPKDIPFAVMSLVALASIYLSKKFNVFLKVILLGLILGVVQSMRILGFSIFLSYILYSFYDLLIIKKLNSVTKIKMIGSLIMEFVVVLLISILVMVIFWPYIGSNVISNLQDIFITSKSYPWVGYMLFNGDKILSTKVGLSYLPVWLLITTPLSVLFLTILSIISFNKKKKDGLYVLFIITFVVNLVMYFVMKPIIYDGLRHYLFLLPIMVVLSTLKLVDIINSKNNKLRSIIIILVIVNLCMVAISQLRLHPYEYIYFNELIGGLNGAKNKFENDYWGASFRESVEWLKNNVPDKNKKYTVTSCANPFQSNYYFTDKFVWVDGMDKADYYICYTRLRNFDGIKDGNTIYVVSREGVPLNFIKKL